MGVFQDMVRKPIEPLELLKAILTWSGQGVQDEVEDGDGAGGVAAA